MDHEVKLSKLKVKLCNELPTGGKHLISYTKYVVNTECITFYKHVGSRQTQTTLLHKWIAGKMKYTHFVVSHVCTYCQWNELYQFS